MNHKGHKEHKGWIRFFSANDHCNCIRKSPNESFVLFVAFVIQSLCLLCVLGDSIQLVYREWDFSLSLASISRI